MDSFLKESKKIVKSYTKIAASNEILSELTGYQYARKAGLHTATLYHSQQDKLTIEYIDGITSFRFLELENSSKLHNMSRMNSIISRLLEDVFTVQSVQFELTSNFQPYNVSKKIAEVVYIMEILNHPDTSSILINIPYLESLFNSFATMPFRDATPKNVLLKNIQIQDCSTLPIQQVLRSIRHIDFRSFFELTTRYDDIISVLYHYQIPDKIRLDFLKYYNIDTDSEEFLISHFIRIARFWGRRHYYQLKQPQRFKKRYELEKIDFYDQQFNIAVRNILNLIPKS